MNWPWDATGTGFIITAVGGAITGWIVALRSTHEVAKMSDQIYHTKQELVTLRIEINHRMEEFIKVTKDAAYAAGIKAAETVAHRGETGDTGESGPSNGYNP